MLVRLASDVVDRLTPGSSVWVGGVASSVAEIRDHQGRPLVRFAHVPDRTAAEALRGAIVEAEPLDTEELDTYLVSELVGVPVIDPHGVLLGTVSGLVEMPAVAGYDLLEVTGPSGSTWLLPSADELVEVVVEDGELRLVATLPEGLLDGTQPGEGVR